MLKLMAIFAGLVAASTAALSIGLIVCSKEPAVLESVLKGLKAASGFWTVAVCVAAILSLLADASNTLARDWGKP